MKPRTLLILLVAVLGLGAFIWFYERELPSSEERKDLEKKVVKVEKDDVTAITVEASKGWTEFLAIFAGKSQDLLVFAPAIEDPGHLAFPIELSPSSIPPSSTTARAAAAAEPARPKAAEPKPRPAASPAAEPARVDHDPLTAQLEEMMGDAPLCDGCGHITVRNGACYKCLNCGNSMGCS